MAIILMLADWVQMNAKLVALCVHTSFILTSENVCVCVFVMADDDTVDLSKKSLEK